MQRRYFISLLTALPATLFAKADPTTPAAEPLLIQPKFGEKAAKLGSGIPDSRIPISRRRTTLAPTHGRPVPAPDP